MKILHISDVHGQFDRLLPRPAEVLILSGDLTRTGTQEELRAGLDWLASWPVDEILYVPGNHDFAAQAFFSETEEACSRRGISFLVDRKVEIGGWQFWGHPWVEKRPEWKWPDQDSAFCFTEGDGNQEIRTASIPSDIDVLISHSPARGLGDVCGPGSYWDGLGELSPGSPALRRYVDTHPQLKLILSGHVHENPGAQRYGRLWCVNAACSLAEILVEDSGPVRSVILTPFKDS